MTFKLTEHYVTYGPRRCPLSLLANCDDDRAQIPLEIEKPEDLDLDAIATELNITAFNRQKRFDSRSPASVWGLEVRVTTQEDCDRLNAKLAADPLFHSMPRYARQVYVCGNGVALRYEAIN